MTIGTHLLMILLIALENFKLATAYHISVEPQATLKYNGHVVSSFGCFFFFFSLHFSVLLVIIVSFFCFFLLILSRFFLIAIGTIGQ